MARPWDIRGLRRAEDVRSGYAKILKTRAAEVLHYAGLVLARPQSVDAVHDLRVSARRLQSALTLSRPLFDKKGMKRLRRRVQELVRALGRVRETDVMILTLTAGRAGIAENARTAPDLLIAQLSNMRTKQVAVLLEQLKRMKSEGFGSLLDAAVAERARRKS